MDLMSERRKRPSLADALDRIPIFPLPQVVLFPEAILPLHVFEPRYREMIRDCLATHGAMVVAQRIAGEDEHGRPRIARVCGGGILVEHQALADGRSNIVVLGLARLGLEELAPEDAAAHPYRLARATILEDHAVSVADNDRNALASAATMFAAEVKRHDPNFSFGLPKVATASQLADLCAYHLVVDAGARQALLEELDPRARVGMVLKQIALQHGAMMRTDGDRVLN